jgi:nitrogen fixation/metabolism regulation signal transduction histidine kinase
MIEVNALSQTLREQRLGALEAAALLRTVIEEIDVAIFTFDNSHTLKLVNRAGERLLARPSERLLGFTAAELGLAGCIEGESARTVELSFPGGAGRWGLRRGSFRQDGLPHDLIVLSDLSRTLREEERQAWQRLIRVLGHELNNSLAPIQSVAQSMESNLQRAQIDTPPSSKIDIVLDDLRQGLAIIRSRTEALSRFMAAYARLARLPQPTLAPVDLRELVRRVAELDTRVRVQVVEGPPVTICADRDQLEQLLINLIRNAAEAVLEIGGEVLLKGRSSGREFSFRSLTTAQDFRTPPICSSHFSPPSQEARESVLSWPTDRGSSWRFAHARKPVRCRGCEARFIMNVS